MKWLKMLSMCLTVLAFWGVTAPVVRAQGQPLSLVCHYTAGPKAGNEENFAGVTGASPAPVGGYCQDGFGSSGYAVAKSSFCHFTAGPLVGQVINYAPQPPLPMGTPCQDHGSVGVVQ